MAIMLWYLKNERAVRNYPKGVWEHYNERESSHA